MKQNISSILIMAMLINPVCLMVITSAQPVNKDITSRSIDDYPISYTDIRQTGNRAQLENDARGGSWAEYFTSGTTANFTGTRLIDNKIQLAIDFSTLIKYSNSPIITTSPGKFDSTALRGNSIIYEGGIFKLWYGGYDGATFKIGYATSLDGRNWTKQNGGNPVLTASASGWDNTYVNGVSVIKDSSEYKMYYTGVGGIGIAQIGLATSTDGIMWTRDPANPILSPGIGFEDIHVGIGTVLKDGNTYRMWYGGNDGTGASGDKIGYATSANGKNWVKNGNNPVIPLGGNGKFDDVSVINPTVTKVGGKFYMFYGGYDGSDYSVGLAESFNGWQWTKLNNGNPVLTHGAGATWDSSRMMEKCIVSMPYYYYLYYAGGTTNSDTKIGQGVANSYQTEGYVISSTINLPNGMIWGNITISKSETTGTSIGITVLDGMSKVIPNYDNLTTSHIDLSKIDRTIYPSIKILAYLKGTQTATPSLYMWGVQWVARNTWRDSFIGVGGLDVNPEVWIQNGQAVLDADPFTWTKSASNPVLTLGGGGAWDSTHVSNPTIIFNGTGYQLYYAGYFAKYQTGLATSTDEVSWVKNPTNPVIQVGGPGTWDDPDAGISAVLYNEDGYNSYKTWYQGYDGQQIRIGYAVSANGQVWINEPTNPVLDGTGGGAWDNYVNTGDGLHGASVLFVNGTYNLWYAGRSAGNPFSIGIATTKDGVSFTKPANSQVMSGTNGKFDSSNVKQPSVIFRRDQYLMFYEGDQGSLASKLGLATSKDGMTWTKQNNGNPVLDLGANGQWDAGGVGGPSVIFKDGLYHLYYHGYDGSKFQVGYAKSSYYSSGYLVSKAISPPGNAIWNRIIVNKTVPLGSSITVDVLNATSDLPVAGYQGLTGSNIDISGISAFQYPSLKLRVNLAGDGTNTPSISDIATNWTITNVAFNGPIPDVSFPEDSIGDNLTNLSKYFNQSRIGPTRLTYSIASNTNPTHVAATFDLDRKHIDYESLVANWSGIAKISVKATDGFMSMTSNVFDVIITPVNDPPIWKGIPTQWLEGNQTYVNKLDLKGYVTDIDSVPTNITYALVQSEKPGNLTVVVETNGLVSYTTKHYFSGFVNVTVSVNDKTTTVATVFKVHINWSQPAIPHYHPPHITTSPGTHATVGIQYKYDVNATDDDVGDVLVYMLKAAPTNMTINPFDGTITWTPTKAQLGTQHIIINVSDQRGMFELQAYDLVVEAPNEPPYFTSSPVLTARVGEQWTYEPKAKDNDSLFLFILMQSGPPNMKIDLLGTNMTWTPANTGKFNVVIYAWDLQARTYQNFTINVLPPNHPPTISQIPDTTIKVGDKYQYKVTAQDTDGDPLTYSIKNPPVGLGIGTDGTITWTPKKQDVGTYPLTVEVSDGKLNATQTYTLKVEKKTVPKTMLQSVMWPLILLVIIVVIIMIVIIVYSRKKKSDKDAEAAAMAAQTSPHGRQPHGASHLPNQETRAQGPDYRSEESGPRASRPPSSQMEYEEKEIINRPPDKPVTYEVKGVVAEALIDLQKGPVGPGSTKGKKVTSEAEETMEMDEGPKAKEAEKKDGSTEDIFEELLGKVDGPKKDSQPVMATAVMAKEVPKAEAKPITEEKLTVEIEGNTYTKEQILHNLTSLPRGLPSTLWGRDMDDLSKDLVEAEYSHTPDGDVIVKLGKKWYFGDPKDLGTYLQQFKGT